MLGRVLMASKISLKRFGTMPLVPVPRAVRAGDYIFTSSVYPVDESGRVVGLDAAQDEVRPSLMEIQARQCLESLKKVFAEAGASMDRVLKAEVHLVDSADFYEFKLVWNEYFPSNPPARTTVEVGDTLPFHGARLNIDAVALASDSKNGLAVGKRPGFPNYGSDAEMQAEYVFTRMNRVLKQVGTSLEEAIESQLYEPNLLTFHDVDGIWSRYMPLPPCRSSMGMKGLIVPGAVFVPNLTVLVPDEDHQKQESFEGINWHPVKVRKVNFSPTLKAGQWRYFAGQVASADFMSHHHSPPGLPHHYSNIEVQTRFLMDMLTRQLEANDTDWAHCHHARVYLIEPRRDYRGFVRVWRKYFPDPAKSPALAFVPSTGIMFNGPLLEIDPSCVAK